MKNTPLFLSFFLTVFSSATQAQPGALDLSFSTYSKLTTTFGTKTEQAHAVAVQADGKIVVAGSFKNIFDIDFGLARYLPVSLSLPPLCK